MSRAVAVAGVLLVAVALTTCGGTDISDKVPGPKSSQEIVDCLKSAAQKANFTVSESEADLDPIAKKTTDRAVAAELKDSRAMIVVEASEQEADETRQAYRGSKFLKDLGTIEQYGAIVVAYDDIPDPMQRDALFECVGSGSKP
jgi:hypothetical protein